MEAIHIRNMQASDLEGILTIQAQCYQEIVPESKVSIQAKLEASPQTCFVADDPARGVAGYMLSIPWQRQQPPELDAPACKLPAQPDCLYLHDLAVSPAYRGSGVGKHLFNAFQKALATTHLPYACLVAIQNSASYWQKYGFAPVQMSPGLHASVATYGGQAQYMEWHAAQGADHPHSLAV